MSVDKLHSGMMRRHVTQHRAKGLPGPLEHVKIGETVSVRIGSKLGAGRYSATIGDKRYVVASDLPLEVGQTVSASVSSLGDTVELRYLGAGQYQLSEAEATEDQFGSMEGDGQLAALQARFKVELSAKDQQQVTALANEVSNPRTLAMSAFYLNKLGEKIDDEQLRALYQSQVWPHSGTHLGVAAADLSMLLKGVREGNKKDVDALALMLGDLCDASAQADSDGLNIQAQQQGTASNDGALQDGSPRTKYEIDPDAELRELAARLLNTQDFGSLAYRYGSVPVMINGQMMELDLVMFHERDSSRSHRQQGLRKLVMTLRTESLGRVEIVAQSIDSILSVSIGTQSPQATELLAGHAQEVRELVGRLGWNVDTVCYRLSNEPARAAEQLVRHVVNAGSLDTVI